MIDYETQFTSNYSPYTAKVIPYMQANSNVNISDWKETIVQSLCVIFLKC